MLWAPTPGRPIPEELELEVHRHITCENTNGSTIDGLGGWEIKKYICDEGYKVQHKDWSSEFESHLTFYPVYKIDYEPGNVATKTAVEEAFHWAATENKISNQITHSWVGADDFCTAGRLGLNNFYPIPLRSGN